MIRRINVHPSPVWANEQLIEFVIKYSGKKVGVLTGGGDAPGCNAVLQGILDKAEELGYLVVAFQDGYKGIVQHPPILSDAIWNAPLDLINLGGTIIGSSRVNPAGVLFDSKGHIVEKKQHSVRSEDREAYAGRAIELLGLDGFIFIGGDNTLGAADRLAKLGFHVVGVPKSIDDDYGLVYAFGRHTAVQRATERIDFLRTTSESHARDIVEEEMGRKCGKIALDSGIAAHANIILIPEFSYKLEQVLEMCANNRRNGQRYNVVVVAESAVPEGGDEVFKSRETDGYGEQLYGGLGAKIAKALSDFYRKEGFGDDIVRDDKVGHQHRSGPPIAVDRVRGYKYGVGAMELVANQKWGVLFGYQEGHYVVVPLDTATIKKRVTEKEYDPERLNARLNVIAETYKPD